MIPPPPKDLMEEILKRLMRSSGPKNAGMVDASMDLTKIDDRAFPRADMSRWWELQKHKGNLMDERRQLRKMNKEATGVYSDGIYSELADALRPRIDATSSMMSREIEKPGVTKGQPLPAILAGLGLQGWEGTTPQELPSQKDLLNKIFAAIGSATVAPGQIAANFMRESGDAQKKSWATFLGLQDAVSREKDPAKREALIKASTDAALEVAPDLIFPMAGTLKYIPEFMQGAPPFAAAKQALGEFLRNRLVKGGRHPLEGVKQRIDFQHSSNKLFPDPVISPDVAGAGAGDQWQGQGFYISEEPKVASFYRNITGRDLPGALVLPNGRSIDLTALAEKISDMPIEMYNKRYPSLQKFRDALYQGSIPKFDTPPANLAYIKKELADVEAQLKSLNTRSADRDIQIAHADLKQYRRDLLDSYARHMKEWQDNQMYGGSFTRIPAQRAEATYSGNFYANPDELFDLQLPINQQPASQKLLGALNEFNYGSRAEPMGDYLAAVQRGVGDPRAVYDINEGLVRHGKSVNTGVTQGPDMPPFMWTGLPNNLKDALFDLEPNQVVSQTLDPWKVMEALRDKGIVGNKYLTRFAAEGLVPPSHNYVVTDPSRVRLNDVWSMLGMLGGGAAATQTIKEKKNDSKRSKPRGG